ncbi:MAG TPA: class I SAM-dependent methyltransferase, partial [Longimicrobiaceae bacterium]|nr:class I SAM-dependent methyltransferase [Longimicrobiaceae bacterium]
METSTPDYRQSHASAAHATRYHERFLRNSHRRGMWKMEQECLSAIVAKHGAGGDSSYMDFACGSGRVTSFMAPRFARSYGVDVSGAMLAIARESGGGVEYVEGDLTSDAGLLAQQFDVVTAFRFFPNAQPELRRAALAAIRDRLKDDGILIWNNHLNVQSTMLRLARALTSDPASRLGMSMEEADRLMAETGFRIVETIGLGVLPFNDRI